MELAIRARLKRMNLNYLPLRFIRPRRARPSPSADHRPSRSTGASSLIHFFPDEGYRDEAPVLRRKVWPVGRLWPRTPFSDEPQLYGPIPNRVLPRLRPKLYHYHTLLLLPSLLRRGTMAA
jgi:hypothetical protein